MISNVYSYYLSEYGYNTSARYEAHSRKQLLQTYQRLLKNNSQTPSYKLDLSEDAQKYAIDLKENAHELSHIANNLTDSGTEQITFLKSAQSSDAQIVSAQYIGNETVPAVSSFEVEVDQLASNQVNTGNFLQPNGKLLNSGEYSFDLSMNDLTYQFEFRVEPYETTKNVQAKVSRLINRSDIGLHSNMETDSLGNTALTISSDTTGISGIRSNIFQISDSASRDTSISEYGNNVTENQNSTESLISILGLDRISQRPSNAVYTIDGVTHTSPINEVTFNKTFDLSFHSTTSEDSVTISLKNDNDSIADSITDLLSGYNRLLSVATDDSNDCFDGNAKLRREFSSISSSYRDQLSRNGIEMDTDGSLHVDRDQIVSAVNSGSLNDILSSLSSFKNDIQQKSEGIAIDPMNYVNNKIIAYKNPKLILNDPYNLSAYTGMMFNDYI